MSELQQRSLTEWLDDLCVRFIINLPQEELESVERICFQVEEAQWFYEDFIRPLDPTLPSMNLKKFCMVIFQHCPLLSEFSQYHHFAAFSEFLAYKQRVPVRGAIILNHAMDQVLLVKGWKKGARWSFPRGKINKDEPDLDCAIREVYEETGYDLKEAGLAEDPESVHAIEVSMREQHMKLFVFRNVPMDTHFEPRTRKEISKIDWYRLSELPTLKQARMQPNGGDDTQQQSSKFYMVAPFLGPLKQWIRLQRKRDKLAISTTTLAALPTDDEHIAEKALAEVNAVVKRQMPIDAGAGHFDDLLAGLRASSYPPEPQYPAAQPQGAVDPATALKRMLSVGQPPATLPGPTPASSNAERHQQGSSNPLLEMLHKGPQPQMRAPAVLPQNRPSTSTGYTPFVPTSSRPALSTPHDVSFDPSRTGLRPQPQPLSGLPYGLQEPGAGQPQVGMSPPVSKPQIPTLQRHSEQASQLLSLFRSNAREDAYGGAESKPQPGFGVPMASTAANSHRNHTIIPQASRLPPPKLTGHTMSLLTALRGPTSGPASHVVRERSQISELSASESEPPIATGRQGAFPKPAPQVTRNAPSQQQANLLNLFQSPAASRTNQALGQEPAELAAHPSPLPVTHLMPKPPSQTTFQAKANTQSQRMPVELGGEPQTPRKLQPMTSQLVPHESPANQPSTENITAPQFAKPVSQHADLTAPLEAPQPISYQALQTPPVLGNGSADLIHSSSGNERHHSVPPEQKDILLSLLTGPAPIAGFAVKRSTATGIMSPVSPFAGSGRSKNSSKHESPAGVDGKSRVSSIAGTMPNSVGMDSGNSADGLPPAYLHWLDAENPQPGVRIPDPTVRAAGGSVPTAVDRSKLLGFLQTVANSK